MNHPNAGVMLSMRSDARNLTEYLSCALLFLIFAIILNAFLLLFSEIFFNKSASGAEKYLFGQQLRQQQYSFGYPLSESVCPVLAYLAFICARL